MSRFLALGVLLLLPVAVSGDVPPPVDQKVVPTDIILEVGEEAGNYRFWLLTYRDERYYPGKAEPLALVPGRPYRIHGQGRDRRGTLVAVSQEFVDLIGERAVTEALESKKGLPEALIAQQSHKDMLNGGFVSQPKHFNFVAWVSVTDPRTCVLERYHLRIDAARGMYLSYRGDLVHENMTNIDWERGALIVAGVLLTGLIIWFGWYAARRIGQTQPATQ
jgi:hypothetical protein